MELLIIFLLIITNGVFAMAEIAIVSARKSKLKHLADKGDKNARAALSLAVSPNRFLSTVQIGITFIGIFAGAFSGETIARDLSGYLQEVPYISAYSDMVALILVVAFITYISLIIGELVPKRLALMNPEKIAGIVARPMNSISGIASPLVALLTISTDVFLRLFRMKAPSEPSVSEDEVRMLIREGTKVGVFDMAEQDIVERTLRLNDKKVHTLMMHRDDITWLDIGSSFQTLRDKISKSSYAYYPVCKDAIDTVVGVVRTEDILTNYLADESIDLKKYLQKPLFVPESMQGLHVLELFKRSGIHMALVVDEYGKVKGLLSLSDILEAIVGDIPTIEELGTQDIIKRDNGTWLVDGMLTIQDFQGYFHVGRFPDEMSGAYHTIGGYMMHKLGHIPAPGERIYLDKHIIEVMDMDGNKVDKLLIIPSGTTEQENIS